MYVLWLIGILLFQTLQARDKVSHAVAIDAQHTLLVVGGRKTNNPAMGEYGMNLVYPNPGEHLRLAISEKSGVRWELSSGATAGNELYGRVARVDGNSVVIARTDSDYGISQPSVKFFFDLASRKLLKTITFDPSVRVTDLKLIDNRVCSTVKAAQIALTSCGDDAQQRIVAQLGHSDNVPEPNIDPLSESYRSPIPVAIPQSTYDQFAKARPGRVRAGYARDVEINERVGGHVVVGNRIWFGKSFYDAEGITGVGAIGYFDAQTRRITMLSIPEIADWSISALLVEGDSVWAGLVTYPESASRSGGLIRYDLATRKVTRYAVPDILLTMVRANAGLFIGTSNGLYVLRNDRLNRFRFEPNIDGEFGPVRDTIP